jgi:hypothetical protein
MDAHPAEATHGGSIAMTVGLRQDVAEIGVRLLDDVHMAWVVAAVDCEHAFRAWSCSIPRNSVERFFAYQAALDREEAAALDLARVWELTQPCHATLALRLEHVNDRKIEGLDCAAGQRGSQR